MVRNMRILRFVAWAGFGVLFSYMGHFLDWQYFVSLGLAAILDFSHRLEKLAEDE